MSEMTVEPPRKPRRTQWDPEARYQTSMQMTDAARDLKSALAKRLGISGADVMEMAIRQLYREKRPHL